MVQKLTFLSLCLLIFTGFCNAQQKAVTEYGNEVVLFNDGTWIYAHPDSVRTDEIDVNDQPFTKSKKASFLIKSKRIPVGCWVDPKKWKFKATENHEAVEFDINCLDGSLYGMMITENLDIPLKSLVNIAIQNARDAAPDLVVSKQEYRVVNGLQVLMMRMTGTIQDVRFSYYGYYLSGDGGATQFLVYASEGYLEEHIDEAEELLNGLVSIAK